MSSVAVRTRPPAPATTGEDYLGPAIVLEVKGRAIRVQMPEASDAIAEPAFVVSYEPVPGDVLLVIARGTSCYAIGVLQGAGRTTLTFPGDVELRAEGGALRLWGEKGVEVLGPELLVQVDKLRTIAGTVTSKLGSLVQRVQSLWSVHAREVHTVVDESTVTKAKSSTLLTEETATINGKQVHLG